MKRRIITTADGSKTIHLEEWNEQYHSKHGAIQEAYHVFIKNGLALFKKRDIHILEIGFGTGLNALITLLEAGNYLLNVHYTGVEAYPVVSEEWQALNYISELKAETLKPHFKKMHECPWGKEVLISDYFSFQKQHKKFAAVADENLFDLIYFDAFGARVQPELWTETIFVKMFKAMKPKGVLVTYSAKGSVRRAMQSAGFLVERLPGPPGKREMLRATKPR
ncbi:tRNA (5-methylaminomethyl-2-thiouridine)(34)-methyltransferase MnmD [Flavobacteriaceae bacterium TP-CH-4]|uniref:tRNA (5-methylaminomethyl-2-thiouridine)(34)-methyltransferase MnmD n=1 Tax=Pelagihabitans pacificus TaxID=2696054 RepID=A0A967E8V3_9FLAO|nr:tRNA (5-methylaminomethyl-2-thiouridine)(34)-methyltransferase MnmD [Pelagihabitans pacificus]NHF57901.1 tRNA (5-methylaminomethyl-2-thiouridine)(34)-methyltransferase MnmD [Pelagihabitans pacificus]